MPRSDTVAKLLDRDPSVVPDDVAPGVLALEAMRKAGVVDAVARLMPLSRRGGYGAGALFAALVALLASPCRTGFRPFLESLAPRMRRQVGTVAGIGLIPTAASMSRALGRFDHEPVRRFLDGLLPLCFDPTMFAHPAVHHLDAHGNHWHVVDIDPTIKAARQRDFAEGPEAPPPTRRAPGEAGYTGRKRGEIRIRAIPAAHEGTGLWLGLQLVAQEGSIVPVVGALTEQTSRVLLQQGVPEGRILIRGDGEFGSVGAMHAIQSRGVHLLVRTSRYQLLERELVMESLKTATWTSVRGQSGRRQAA